MRILVILGVVLLLGMVGVVMTHEPGGSASGGAGNRASLAPIEILSHGEAVDIDAHVPTAGWTVVEFTADW